MYNPGEVTMIHITERNFAMCGRKGTPREWKLGELGLDISKITEQQLKDDKKRKTICSRCRMLALWYKENNPDIPAKTQS